MRTVRRVEPGPGPESVRDSCRPARVVGRPERVHIRLGGRIVVDTPVGLFIGGAGTLGW